MSLPITPPLATPAPGASVQFQSTVAASKWELVRPADAGTLDVGQINADTGLYVAPATIPKDLRVTVRATDKANSTNLGDAIIQLTPPPLKVLPDTVELAARQQQRFTAEPACYARDVVWKISPSSAGRLDDSGRYTAPWFVWAARNVVVTATSGRVRGAATVTLSDSRFKVPVVAGYFAGLTLLFLFLLLALWPQVSVNLRQPQLLVLPRAATVLAGETFPMAVRLSGTTNAPASSVAWSATAGGISPEGRFTAPTNGLHPDAVVTATLAAAPDQSDCATLWISTNASLSLHPEVVTLAGGQSALFQVRLQPAAGDAPAPVASNLVWAVSPAGAGSITADGTYQAPASVSAARLVTVQVRHRDDPFLEAAAVVQLTSPTPGWMHVLLPQLGLILLLGAIGGLMHAGGSFTYYLGIGQFKTSWFWWYIFRPLQGAGLALVFFLVVGAGLLNVETGRDMVGLGALAILVGLFSYAAMHKLASVAESLFGSQHVEARTGPAGQPGPGPGQTPPVAPHIQHVTPATMVPAQTPPPELIVRGSGFDPNCRVRINSVEHAPDSATATELRVRLTAQDVAQPGSLTVAVVNATQQVSNEVQVKIA